jgi:hypothetical protein
VEGRSGWSREAEKDVLVGEMDLRSFARLGEDKPHCFPESAAHYNADNISGCWLEELGYVE